MFGWTYPFKILKMQSFALPVKRLTSCLQSWTPQHSFCSDKPSKPFEFVSFPFGPESHLSFKTNLPTRCLKKQDVSQQPSDPWAQNQNKKRYPQAVALLAASLICTPKQGTCRQSHTAAKATAAPPLLIKACTHETLFWVSTSSFLFTFFYLVLKPECSN